MNIFYDTIDALCKLEGINHSILAMRCGVGPVTFHRYLTLEREFKLVPFMALCRTLDLSPQRLYAVYDKARKEQNNDKH